MSPVKRRGAAELGYEWTEVHRKLLELTAYGPGENRELLGRARRLLYAWRGHEDSVIRRRSMDVQWAFEDWFSDRAWTQLHDDGTRARHTLTSLIQHLHAEVQTLYHPARTASGEPSIGPELKGPS
jgi:hypothetical protein